MRRYETTFILSPDLEEADIEKNIARYANIITTGGGTIEKDDRWGTRRLAYQIRKKTQGYFVQLVHESGPNIPRELERQFLLNENCLRYLTVLAQKPAPEPAVVADTKAAVAEKPAADTEGDKPEEPEADQTPSAEDQPVPASEPDTTENPIT